MPTDPHDMLREDLAASDFAPHVATAFTLWLGATPVPLILDAVDGVGADPERSFTLRFRTSGAGTLPQGTYPVEHEAVGRMALFLVPVRPQATGAVAYEAVFNRSSPSA